MIARRRARPQRAGRVRVGCGDRMHGDTGWVAMLKQSASAASTGAILRSAWRPGENTEGTVHDTIDCTVTAGSLSLAQHSAHGAASVATCHDNAHKQQAAIGRMPSMPFACKSASGRTPMSPHFLTEWCSRRRLRRPSRLPRWRVAHGETRAAVRGAGAGTDRARAFFTMAGRSGFSAHQPTRSGPGTPGRTAPACHCRSIASPAAGRRGGAEQTAAA